MSENLVQDCPAEARTAARTNLFLAASLLSDGVAHPVRIRDLSASGARVETSVVPEVGATLSLVRGRLRVACLVTWSAGLFCGLRFAAPVSVLEWMTHRVAQERRRLDDLAPATGRSAAEVAAARFETEQAARVARDLGQVSRLLETIGEALAGDPQVVLGHGEKLQSLALAIQTLVALAETMRAGARGSGRAARDERRA